MSVDSETLPVHDSLTVVDYENLYKTDEWWKAAVRYRHESSEESEVAVYLWHKDDEWTRKNKYNIKAQNAWETDKQVVEEIFAGEGDTGVDFPTSDYYNVDIGQTVVKENGWWKAIVRIDEKGSYETEEVVIYLWQERDGEWKRRQKFTIKEQERWMDDADVVESVVDGDDGAVKSRGQSDVSDEPQSANDDDIEEEPIDEIQQLSSELDDHLGQTVRE
jgi:hypothetical protein